MNKSKISVCMATYNGANFIKDQLISILNQISETDEIIISDDSSNDNTIEIIDSFNDNRIKVYKNSFRNVVKNFEFSISQASGDIIFLSDQDDIWHPDKVKEYMEQFYNSDVSLVISNLKLIDKQGTEIGKNFFQKGFNSNFFYNILKNNFIGCSLAFKRELVSKIIPFPDNIPMHDWWIGLIVLRDSKMIYINKELTYYRRHGGNFTSDNKSSIKNIIIWRLNLIFNLFFKR